mgnify:CR=1 FL=1|tara:strand:- start:2323 stop:3252 length:930 start_codon:yes stop_codon:yes gene_type:complete
MFYEVNRTASVDDTFVSSATMRAHVRAIDDSEDDLLDIYRNAAVDYLQNLSDRVLGLSTAKVLLDYYEFRAPFRIQKLQDITAVNTLEYLKDGEYIKHIPTLPDDEIHGHHVVASLIFSNGLAKDRIVEVEAYDTAINVRMTGADSDGASVSYFTVDKYNFHSEEWSQVATSALGQLTTSYTFTAAPAGLYRFNFFATVDSEHTHSSHRYFAINNGTLFKNKMLFEQYPARFDFSELCNLVEYDEDMDNPFRMELMCGTSYNTLPKQYTQAALLLIGHYYNMREAENIGGITSEVKEGVRRLVASVRQF